MTWLYRVLVICALIGLLAPGYGAWAAHQQGIGETRATASYNAAIDRQKAQAGRLLTTETQKAATATKALHHSKVEREIDDAENARTVAALAGCAIPTPRLQNGGGGGGGAQGADPARAGGGAADTPEAGGPLSPELSKLLFEQARTADEINLAYTSCRADALSLRQALQ